VPHGGAAATQGVTLAVLFQQLNVPQGEREQAAQCPRISAMSREPVMDNFI
jgi:hypothetical protein